MVDYFLDLEDTESYTMLRQSNSSNCLWLGMMLYYIWSKNTTIIW